MKKAFSLYELLVVLAIIAIVVVITVPLMSYYRPSLMLSSSARAVSSKLRQAQEEAVTTQIRHGIKFNPTASPPTIEFIKKESLETTLETVTLDNGVTMTLNAITEDKVIFSSDGGLSTESSAGTITIILNSASKIISVNPAGMIKLQ